MDCCRLHWRYLILDEAHRLRNPRTLNFIAAFTVIADHYLALSGTPVINRLRDKEKSPSIGLGHLSISVSSKLCGARFRNSTWDPCKGAQHRGRSDRTQKGCYNHALAKLKDSMQRQETGKVLSCITRLRRFVCPCTRWSKQKCTKMSSWNPPKFKRSWRFGESDCQQRESDCVLQFKHDAREAACSYGGILLTGQATMETRNQIRSLLDANSILFSNFHVAARD